MGMSILLGRNRTNRFREAMLGLARFPGDVFIVSTGYIDEDIFYNQGSYDKSLSNSILSSLPWGGECYIIGGRFWKHTGDSCKPFGTDISRHNKGTNEDCYMCGFSHFVEFMSQEAKAMHYRQQVYRHHNQNWHAKLALKLRKVKTELRVVGALVGSSNLTSRAFSAHHQYPNTECDVFMWDRKFLSKKGVSVTYDTLDPYEIERYRDGFIDILPVHLTKGLPEKAIFSSLLAEISPYLRDATKV